MELFGRLRGDVPVADLLVRRQAGSRVLELENRAEQVKAGLLLADAYAWTADEASQTRLLTTWAATASFYAAGEAFDAAQQARGNNAMLPAGLVGQLTGFFRQSEEWQESAEAAFLAKPGLRIDEPLRLPEGLPTELTQLDSIAARTFAESMQRQVQFLLGDVHQAKTRLPREFYPLVEEFRQQEELLQSGLARVVQLLSGQSSSESRRESCGEAWRLSARYFLLGQQVIVPRLYDRKYAVKRTIKPCDPTIKRAPVYDPGQVVPELKQPDPPVQSKPVLPPRPKRPAPSSGYNPAAPLFEEEVSSPAVKEPILPPRPRHERAPSSGYNPNASLNEVGVEELAKPPTSQPKPRATGPTYDPSKPLFDGD